MRKMNKKEKQILPEQEIIPIRINGITFLEFCGKLWGHNFFCKKTGNQIFRYQLFYSKQTIDAIFKRYRTEKTK